ncbi:hypothetical protein FJY70_01130 [candidate division WOR-3 bacterium]|nr:hypothetical protein [candidate division WOR-3 bacterium]MBM3314262.1 hypothetical protein [candidate division WOR-3 bacterium]
MFYRVRVLRTVKLDGRRLRPGEEVTLHDSVAGSLIVNGTVLKLSVVSAPGRQTYSTRPMLPEGGRCSRSRR